MQVYHDNLKVVKDINKSIQKTSGRSIDESCSVNEIRRILKKLKFTVAINHQPSIKKKIPSFYQDPLVYIIQQYNIAARKMREEVEMGIR